MSKVTRSLVLVFMAFSGMVQAQTGLYPFGSFDNTGFDTVDRGSLNVHFAIPVVSKPGRGVGFQYQIVYDSLIWAPSGVMGSQTWSAASGWGFTGQLNGEGYEGYLSYSSATVKCYPSGGGSFFFTTNTSNYVYHDAFGANHPFTYADNTCSGVVTAGGASKDGSGYSYSGGYITDRSGRVINAPVLNQTSIGSIADSNGNSIANNGNGTFTDTLGKTVLTITGSGTPSSPKYFTYSTPTGTASVTVNYQSHQVQTNFGCAETNWNLPENLVSSIVLADGSTYSFTYEPTPGYPNNVTGRIASVTLPQGGTINYAYTGSNFGIICADGTTAGLTRTGGVTRTYTRSSVTAGSSQTNVTDGLNNASIFNFAISGSPEAFYETYRANYQGAASGSPLLAQYTCYNSTAAPCTTTAVAQPVSQVDTYGTMNGEQQGSQQTYNAFGLLTTKTDYDYSTSATTHGTLLRQETWTYPTSGIVNLVSQDQVTDGRTLIGLTTYAYDETSGAGHAALVGTSGLPNHTATAAQRGNLTTLNQYYTPQSYLTSAAAYEDTGNPVSVTGPTGKATTILYESSTHAFPYTVMLPTPSSGVLLTSYATNDLNSGVLLTTQDANAQTTTYKTYNSLLQPLEIDHPDGGSVIAGYSPNSFGFLTSISGSPSANTETSQDPYGRLNWVAVQNDSGGYYWNNYCYDNNGELQYAAYRFAAVNQANLSCSGAGDSYAYDALGRMTTVTHADGYAKHYSYAGRATQTTDELGASRVVQVDGLGRVTSVCEVSANAQESVAPVACGLDIAATGFLTTYVYNTDYGRANGQLVTVTQGSQTRYFETDFLGRTTLVVEPESNVTTYGYSYNGLAGLGLTVTRTRPTPNQGNQATTTTTTTQYDSLGRVVSVSYSDGTPAKTFTYDLPSSASIWNSAETSLQTNLKGRLASHNRATAAGITGAIYGYDAMGRVTTQFSCLPSGCGNTAYNRQVSYGYNWAGMLTSESDGAGDTYTYRRSRAGEITSLVDSFSDATDPANIIVNGSVQNGPNGPTLYTMGNGLNVVNTYDSLGRLNGGFVCAGSSQASCTGGTLQAYGFTAQRAGTKVTQSCDTVLGVCNSFGYDEFSRLASRTVTQGTVQNFTYAYDRYGNRWAQNAPQGGPMLNMSFSAGNNMIGGSAACESASSFCNDIAGNVTGDTFHQYSYDPDGNLISVDGGGTATYTYDSLNQRVQIAPSRGTYEFVWDIFGRRVSNWSASSHTLVESNAYTDSGPIAIRGGGTRIYESQNWLGTERVRTTYNGAVSISIASLPWADQHTPTGDNGDQHDFAGMDRDLEDATEHAQHRQFSTNLGRWLAPDQYLGSYDFSNPQSFNRYSYALNDPANLVDPSGLYTLPTGCGIDNEDCGEGPSNPSGCVASGAEGCILDPTENPGDSGSGGGGSSGSAPSAPKAPSNGQEPPPTCQAKILNATNNQFGTNYTDANVNSTFNYSTGAGPGQGTLNLNISGSTAGVSTGYYPLHWYTYVIGYGSTLHVVSGPGGHGGLDSQQTLPFGPNGGTFHIDSGYPINPIGAAFHWLLNMTKVGGYPKC